VLAGTDRRPTVALPSHKLPVTALPQQPHNHVHTRRSILAPVTQLHSRCSEPQPGNTNTQPTEALQPKPLRPLSTPPHQIVEQRSIRAAQRQRQPWQHNPGGRSSQLGQASRPQVTRAPPARCPCRFFKAIHIPRPNTPLHPPPEISPFTQLALVTSQTLHSKPQRHCAGNTDFAIMDMMSARRQTRTHPSRMGIRSGLCLPHAFA